MTNKPTPEEVEPLPDKPLLYEPLPEYAAAYVAPGMLNRLRREKFAEIERKRGLHLSFQPCEACGDDAKVDLRNHVVNGLRWQWARVGERPPCKCGGRRLAVFGPWPLRTKNTIDKFGVVS